MLLRESPPPPLPGRPGRKRADKRRAGTAAPAPRGTVRGRPTSGWRACREIAAIFPQRVHRVLASTSKVVGGDSHPLRPLGCAGSSGVDPHARRPGAFITGHPVSIRDDVSAPGAGDLRLAPSGASRPPPPCVIMAQGGRQVAGTRCAAINPARHPWVVKRLPPAKQPESHPAEPRLGEVPYKLPRAVPAQHLPSRPCPARRPVPPGSVR